MTDKLMTTINAYCNLLPSRLLLYKQACLLVKFVQLWFNILRDNFEIFSCTHNWSRDPRTATRGIYVVAFNSLTTWANCEWVRDAYMTCV